MRRIVIGLVVLLAVGAFVFITPQTQSQEEEAQRDSAAQNERSPDEPRPEREPGGPGGFSPPPPPVLTAIDTDNDGVISAEELQNAPAALRTLDENDDGELADAELLPDFGAGGFPFPGGGGRRGGFRFGEGDANAERLNPGELEFRDGVAEIPDHAMYHELSYKGEEVMIDTFLAGLEFVKFTLDEAASDQRQLYFINTQTHRAHMMFARVAGLPFGRGNEQMKGVLVYRPMLKAPSGAAGLYTFEFEPFDAYSFEMVKICRDELIARMPILEDRVGYYPRGEGAIARYEAERSVYDDSDVSVFLDEDLVNTDVGYLPLNPGETFGLLRLMDLDERPGPRDVVLYRSLPNELPRVAGIITAVRQTPLSHVNLRAVQDRVPNAFITAAAENGEIESLIGEYVCYRVTDDGYEIREATLDEVEAHFADLRPADTQIPPRELSVTQIRPLNEVSFEDSSSVGVKASNLATLRTFGFPEETVPDGFAVPFYFYDEFMKHNGFYEYAAELLDNPEFQDRDTQVAELKEFRSLIKKGTMPEWMMEALGAVHQSFPEGSSVRCRSSTNNEDLPAFSGAGLYDSYTHYPDEGHFSKTIRQVYASLWNFRAFEEREFYRVDHFVAAMGVLVHPNFKNELANGVAVTDDILYQSEGNYYLNTQVGEDLVTNPERESIPEEILLDWWDSSDLQVMRTSNRSLDGELLLSDEQLDQLREHLGVIHAEFAYLYGAELDDERFAMEIEFKITSEGELAIKQARPWIFAQP